MREFFYTVSPKQGTNGFNNCLLILQLDTQYYRYVYGGYGFIDALFEIYKTLLVPDFSMR